VKVRKISIHDNTADMMMNHVPVAKFGGGGGAPAVRIVLYSV
jgi:hypothetical protein